MKNLQLLTSPCFQFSCSFSANLKVTSWPYGTKHYAVVLPFLVRNLKVFLYIKLLSVLLIKLLLPFTLGKG